MVDLYRGSTTIDFDFDMKAHPVTGDLVLKRDEQAIVQSVKNLVQTNYGEVLHNIELDGGVGDLLFNTISSITTFQIKSRIENVIKAHEPRVEVDKVTAYRTEDMNGIVIRISFYYANNPTPYETEFTLNRIR